jgi:galactokinase
MHINTIQTGYRLLLEKVHNGIEPIVVRAPGRINLIGEHTDYNGGLAMPAAINRYLYISVSKRNDDLLRLQAEGFASVERTLGELNPLPGAWHTYVEGVAAVLMGRGHHIGGFNLHVFGNIPIGAGLSSSAALCCGTVLALDALFKLGLRREEMALLAQQAEHNFAGVQCGLMDQYACLFGKRGYALQLDLQTLKFQYVRLNLETLDLVLLNTGVKHCLAATEYNLRKTETRRALTLVQAHFPAVTSMRDITLDMLYGSVLIPDPVAFKRARFFLEENKRVDTVAVALSRRMLTLVGELLYESHQGLAALYNVSCPELDLLIRLAKEEKAVTGARLMGGGFGGCTINLVEKKNKTCTERIAAEYRAHTGRELTVERLLTADGARILDAREIRNIILNREETYA